MSCSPMTLRRLSNVPVWQLSIGLAHLIVGGVCTIPPTMLHAQNEHELLRIPADPAKGFLWPYYLSVPSTLVRPAIILVEPNNSGTTSDDQWFHDEHSKSTITRVFQYPSPDSPDCSDSRRSMTPILRRSSFRSFAPCPGGNRGTPSRSAISATISSKL